LIKQSDFMNRLVKCRPFKIISGMEKYPVSIFSRNHIMLLAVEESLSVGLTIKKSIKKLKQKSPQAFS